MATETLRLSSYDRKPDLVVTVTYTEVPYSQHSSAGPSHEGRELKAYEVRLAGGKLAGRVSQTIFSTDRHYNRIRLPGKGRIGWAWARPGHLGEHGRVYGRSTRRNAVAELLGYSGAESAEA
jgi:hypothetical protein